jgi:isocitrate dehydrogenase
MPGKVQIPKGEKISIDHGKLRVPDNPIIAFVEGDGTGPDIWRASVRVLDAAVEQSYKGKKKIAWAEVYAGEKAQVVYGKDCPRRRSTSFGSTSSPSRARSPRRWARGSGRST